MMVEEGRETDAAEEEATGSSKAKVDSSVAGNIADTVIDH
jgi:hypothetical protein